MADMADRGMGHQLNQLLAHRVRRAASRACWTAGSRRLTRIVMMEITTSNSMSVKPEERDPWRSNLLNALMQQ